jgi:hypothetical protein
VSGPQPKAFEPNYERAKRSTKHENRFAGRLGGRRLPRSGGLAWSRHDRSTDGGDITTTHLHIEHKRAEPQTKSIGIKRDWLQKVTEGANRQMKIPAMGLTFEDALGFEQDWVAVPLSVMERFLKALDDD